MINDKSMFNFTPFPNTGTRIYSEAQEAKVKGYDFSELKAELAKEEKELKELRGERDDTNTVRSRSNFTLDEQIKAKQLEVNKLKEELASRMEGQGKEADLPDKVPSDSKKDNDNDDEDDDDEDDE